MSKCFSGVIPQTKLTQRIAWLLLLDTEGFLITVARNGSYPEINGKCIQYSLTKYGIRREL